jgi:hypothetical protein
VCIGSPIGPSYPPPGGVTFSATGTNAGTGNGETFSFSNFDPTAYGSLWWGPENFSQDGNGIQGPAGDMTYSGFNNSVTGWSYTTGYEWDSSTPWVFSSVQTGTVDLNTRFVLAFTGLADPTSKSSAGIASGNTNEEVAQVLGNFSGSFVFQVQDPYDGNQWVAVDDFFNQYNTFCTNCVTTSATFGFWSTPNNAVPEPRLYGLILAGMIGLAMFLRRRYLA